HRTATSRVARPLPHQAHPERCSPHPGTPERPPELPAPPRPVSGARPHQDRPLAQPPRLPPARRVHLARGPPLPRRIPLHPPGLGPDPPHPPRPNLLPHRPRAHDGLPVGRCPAVRVRPPDVGPVEL